MRIDQMEPSTRVLAEYLSRVRLRKAKALVKDKVLSGTCLLCDEPAKSGNRGHCDYHHGQFKYARALAAEHVSLTREEERRGVTLTEKVEQAKKEFDEDRVARGLVLVSQQGKHGKHNPFKRTA